jgi:hypothetical protein
VPSEGVVFRCIYSSLQEMDTRVLQSTPRRASAVRTKSGNESANVRTAHATMCVSMTCSAEAGGRVYFPTDKGFVVFQAMPKPAAKP